MIIYTSRTLFIQDRRSFLVLDIIALIMSAKWPLQTFRFQCWLKKVCCNYSYSLGLLPFPLYMLEAADEFKIKSKTKVQYNTLSLNIEEEIRGEIYVCMYVSMYVIGARGSNQLQKWQWSTAETFCV